MEAKKATDNIGTNESKFIELEEKIKHVHDQEISDEELQELCQDAARNVHRHSLQQKMEMV